MKILFIISIDRWSPNDLYLPNSKYIHFGISSLSSFLKKHNNQTRLLILASDFKDRNYKLIDKYVEEFKPDIAAFTAVSTQYPTIAKAISYVKTKYPNIYKIIGGPHATLNPSEVIKSDCDALCIGEGEHAILELANTLQANKKPKNINNLWIKNKNIINKNVVKNFYQDLDELPFTDREIWQEWTDSSRDDSLNILLGRGCPFNCSYCSNHALKKISNGKYVRFRSPKNIIKEIDLVLKNFPKIKKLYLEIETIAADVLWLEELCKGLKKFKDKKISFGTNLRITPGQDLEKIFNLFNIANINFINIGIESGSERIRDEVLRRNYKNEDIIKAINLAKLHKIKVTTNNIIGLPNETWSDYMETVKLNRICQPDTIENYIFYPYPGTDLYNLCKKNKYIDLRMKKIVDKTPSLERHNSILNLPTFSQRKIIIAHSIFEYLVYKNYKNNFKLIVFVLIQFIRSNHLLSYFSKSFFNYEFQRKIYHFVIGKKDSVKSI